MQIFQHLHVIRAGCMAAIQKMHQKAYCPVRLEIAVNQLIPAGPVRIGYLGIAIPGQIHKIGSIRLIKIDGGRFTGR